MKQNLCSYLKIFIIYFFITTPFIVGITFASIPEAITIKPMISMRIFFFIISLGLCWILFRIIEPNYKNFKFKTALLIFSILLSTIFCMLSLSY